MISVSLNDIRKKSRNRPAGYAEDVISRGKITGTWLQLDEGVYRQLCAKYGRAINVNGGNGLGDKIGKIADPIARALKLPCIDKKTQQLKPESGCAKMKARLNAGMTISEAMKLRLKGR